MGLAVFTLASLLCALSSSLPMLALARALQGFGAAGIMSVNAALVRYTYPQKLLGQGIGINTLVIATSSAAGPTIASGVLAVAHWQWLFLINVPIGIVALALALRSLPYTEPSGHHFDLPSAVLSALTFGLLITGIDSFGHALGLPIVPGGTRRARCGGRRPGAPAGIADRADPPGRPFPPADLCAVGADVDVLVHRAGDRVRGDAVLLPGRPRAVAGRDRAPLDALADRGGRGAPRSPAALPTVIRPACWAGLGLPSSRSGSCSSRCSPRIRRRRTSSGA